MMTLFSKPLFFSGYTGLNTGDAVFKQKLSGHLLAKLHGYKFYIYTVGVYIYLFVQAQVSFMSGGLSIPVCTELTAVV